MTDSEPLRHRLIPTRGRPRSWFAFGPVSARIQAEEYAVENDIPVLVCSAPEKGIVRRLYTVAPPKKPRATR